MFNLFHGKETEYNYFDTFEDMASLIVQTTDLISENINNYQSSSIDTSLNEIRKTEKIAKEKKRELIDYLYMDFLPPIERLDIIEVVHSLNHVLEKTGNLMAGLDMYRLTSIHVDFLELVRVLVKLNSKLPQIMSDLEEFKHPKNLFIVLKEMDQIMNEARLTHHAAVKNIYIHQANTFKLIKYNQMYNCFDEAFLAIEQLMKSVEVVIIQNT